MTGRSSPGSCQEVEKGAGGGPPWSIRVCASFPLLPRPRECAPPLCKQVYLLEPVVASFSWCKTLTVKSHGPSWVFVRYFMRHTQYRLKNKEPKDCFRIRWKQSRPGMWEPESERIAWSCCTDHPHSSGKSSSNTHCSVKPTSQSWLKHVWQRRRPDLASRPSLFPNNNTGLDQGLLRGLSVLAVSVVWTDVQLCLQLRTPTRLCPRSKKPGLFSRNLKTHLNFKLPRGYKTKSVFNWNIWLVYSYRHAFRHLPQLPIFQKLF